MPDETSASGAPLRILFVTSDKFPPFRPAAKAIFSEGVTDRGHEVDWLIQAADPTAIVGEQPYKSGRAFVAPTDDGSGRLARLKKHWADLRNDFRVFRLSRAHDYSLIQIKDKYIGALLALAAGKLHRIPVLYWLAYPHGEASSYAAAEGMARYSLFYRLRGAWQRYLLYRVILPSCDHIFVQSEQMRADIAAEGISAKKMTAVPSSVNLAQIDEALENVRGTAPLRPNTIVYLGTLLRERRLDMLVRTLARVRERVPDAELLFVGRGETPEDDRLLRREAERLGLSKVVATTGWLPTRIALKTTQSAAVCVSPYYPTAILQSTSPTKLVEYMALAKPVVANSHPEQSDVVMSSGCGLVCEWSESEFADAIVEILENPERAAAMGAAGREFVEAERTHSVMTDLVLMRYREVLRHSTAPRGWARFLRASAPVSPPQLRDSRNVRAVTKLRRRSG